MKLLEIFRTKQANTPTETKGYYEDPSNRQNAYLRQMFSGIQTAMSLPDWMSSADRESLYKLYADKDKANHAVYAVVNGISSAMADVMQYAELIDKNEKVIENHWSEDLLNNPNDAQTMSEFIQLWGVNYLVVGDAFTYGLASVFKREGRKFGSMYVMPSHIVEIISGGLLVPIKGFQIKGKTIYSGGTPDLNPDNVMFCKMSNPSAESFYGLSPLVAVLKDAEILENGKKRTNGAIKNGGVNNLIFPQPSDNMGITPQQRDEFEKEVNKKHAGNYNKMINVPVGVARLGDTPADLALLQSNEASVQAICNAYNYPIDLLFGRSTFSNMGEAKKMRYELAIPYANYFLEKYSKWTSVSDDGLKWRINTDGIEALKPDPNTVITAMNNAGTTINERREYLGYTPIKDDIGDKVTYPMNLSFGDDDQELSKPLPETDLQPKPTK